MREPAYLLTLLLICLSSSACKDWIIIVADNKQESEYSATSTDTAHNGNNLTDNEDQDLERLLLTRGLFYIDALHLFPPSFLHSFNLTCANHLMMLIHTSKLPRVSLWDRLLTKLRATLFVLPIFRLLFLSIYLSISLVFFIFIFILVFIFIVTVVARHIMLVIAIVIDMNESRRPVQNTPHDWERTCLVALVVIVTHKLDAILGSQYSLLVAYVDTLSTINKSQNALTHGHRATFLLISIVCSYSRTRTVSMPI